MLTISLDFRGFTIEVGGNKQRYDCRIGRAWILAGTEDVEISQCNRFQSVKLRENLAIAFANVFGQRIRGSGIGRERDFGQPKRP